MNGQQIAGRPGDARPGMPATILRRDAGKSALAEATYGGQQGFNVWLTLDPAGCALHPGQDVIIACGPVSERIALLARVRDISGDRVVLIRQSPWRPVDTRAFPRFATSMSAHVLRGERTVAATIVDISLGGMAIEVSEPLEADSIEVRIGEDPAAFRLPCLVVSKQRREDASVLHVEFGTLTDEVAASIERLVTGVAGESGRELLAS